MRRWGPLTDTRRRIRGTSQIQQGTDDDCHPDQVLSVNVLFVERERTDDVVSEVVTRVQGYGKGNIFLHRCAVSLVGTCISWKPELIRTRKCAKPVIILRFWLKQMNSNQDLTLSAKSIQYTPFSLVPSIAQ